jgi:hypothetical protein
MSLRIFPLRTSILRLRALPRAAAVMPASPKARLFPRGEGFTDRATRPHYRSDSACEPSLGDQTVPDVGVLNSVDFSKNI